MQNRKGSHLARTVYGNISGMKKADLELLQGIYSLQANKNGIIPLEAAQLLAAVSGSSRRELVVLIDRRGNVVYVGAGDADTAQLQEHGRRRGESRLSGLRCIHTHPSGSGLLSPADYAAITAMRLDAMAALGVRDGKIKEAYVACPEPRDGLLNHACQSFGPMSAAEMADFPLLPLLRDIETKIKPPAAHETSDYRELLFQFLYLMPAEPQKLDGWPSCLQCLHNSSEPYQHNILAKKRRHQFSRDPHF